MTTAPGDGGWSVEHYGFADEPAAALARRPRSRVGVRLGAAVLVAVTVLTGGAAVAATSGPAPEHHGHPHGSPR